MEIQCQLDSPIGPPHIQHFVRLKVQVTALLSNKNSLFSFSGGAILSLEELLTIQEKQIIVSQIPLSYDNTDIL